MKLSIVLLGCISSSLARSAPSEQPALTDRDPKPGKIPKWHPPGPGDLRGPCPMMNTLANHGILPRDGCGITRDVVIKAMKQGLNFDRELAVVMFDQAVVANPEPNATYFTLGHLNRHNVLEHDGSLSRPDAFFGARQDVFNATVFEQARRWWTEPLIQPKHMAHAKVARQLESAAFNPTYRFTATVESFSLGEMAAPFVAFGDLDAATVNRTLVEYFFRNERLPTELGWRTRDEVVKLEAILRVSNMIAEASNLLTVDGDGSGNSTSGTHAGSRTRTVLRRGFHAGERLGL